jgi:GAF domain-containing protein
MGRHADLVRNALTRTGDVFAADTIQVGILRRGVLDLDGGAKPGKEVWNLIAAAIRDRQLVQAQAADRALIVVPLEVSGEIAGVVLAERPNGSFSSVDRRLLDLLAGHVALELDNTRLYRQLDTLLHQFMPDEVAQQVIADPDQAALGGSIRDS